MLIMLPFSARMLARPPARSIAACTSSRPVAPSRLASFIASSNSRRYSSSKPSSDPSEDDSSPNNLGTSSSRQQRQPSQQSRSSERNSSGHDRDLNSSRGTLTDGTSKRRSRKSPSYSNSALKAQQDAFSQLPTVPSTQHIHPNDIYVASFFSLDRPMSVTTAVPQVTRPSAFDSIFDESGAKSGRPSTSDVFSTLNSTVESMENGMSGNDGPIIVVHGPNGQQHHSLDGEDEADVANLRNPMQDFAQQFRPFNPPPAPVPTDLKSNSDTSHSDGILGKIRQSVERNYSSVLTISESTHSDGQTTYEAHTTPFVRINKNGEPLEAEAEADVETEKSGANENVETSTSSPSTGVPVSRFLERMRLRQMRFDDIREQKRRYYSISVRRQRKLKIKKHKHKKLLRRTRTLRRKLDKS